MSEKIDSSDSCIIVDMIDNSNVYSTDTTHTSLSSHSAVSVQKPVQVVPPTPVVRQAASPAVASSSALPPAAPPPSSVNFAVPGQPLLQQNVNIMNINLPTVSSQAPTSTTALSTAPSSNTQAATLIQLPDGRFLLQQAAPTFAFVSAPVQGVNSSGQSFAITVPGSGNVAGGCQHQSAVQIVQQPVTQQVVQQVTQPAVQTVAVPHHCGHTASIGVGSRSTPQRLKTAVQTGSPISQTSPASNARQCTHSSVINPSSSNNPSSLSVSNTRYGARPNIINTSTTILSNQPSTVTASTTVNTRYGTRPSIINTSTPSSSNPSSTLSVATAVNSRYGARPSIINTSTLSSSNVPTVTSAGNAQSTGTRPILMTTSTTNHSSTVSTSSLNSTSIPTSSNRNASTVIQTSTGLVHLPSKMPPEELRRKIDQQIARLRAVPNPGPKEKLMLQRLSDLSDQIPNSSRTVEPPPPPPPLDPPTPIAPSTSVQVVPKPASPLSELNALLSDTQYLLMKPNPNEETLLVEFRVPNQRFMLRLTRSQKAELETILGKTNTDVHQKLLSILHERLASANTSSLLPTVSARSAAQRVRRNVAQPSQSLQSVALSTRKPTSDVQIVHRSQPQILNSNIQSKSPARPSQQVVLTPQMRRSLQIRRQLQTEQQKAACPTTTEPFRLVKEAAIALMKYHVYQDTDNSDHATAEVDAMLGEATDLLRKRQRHLLSAVRRIERRCISQNGMAPIAIEEGGPNAEEAYIITNMALDLERDTLEEERKRYQERPHSFQPLNFDLRTGKAIAVPLHPPPTEEVEEEVKREKEDDENAAEDEADVWESFLESEKNGQVSEPRAKRRCVPEESETDRAVAAIMGETGLSSWTSSTSVIHSEDPDVDAAIRSIM